ncbi:uncharacterized protein LOC109850718 isoform X2 [Asparagus officinalis]|uniref:uncharacterized protein LOC109850718 isoform X2 n=1 Tax=Asparagus officinalis TaxID=4686 RepID=UPI00098E3B76|nr:uncharacterized protein LOC109850718 isoform X2 [Asparagus officinalis]
MEAAAEEEQDGLSVHSPGQAPPSSASSLPKEHSQVDLELRILEALEIYPPSKLKGVHRHFVLYGLMEFMQRSFDRHFSADEILQLLDRFFNLEMLSWRMGISSSNILHDSCKVDLHFHIHG